MIMSVREKGESSDLKQSGGIALLQRVEVQTSEERKITMKVERIYKLKVLLILCVEVKAAPMQQDSKDREILKMEEKEAPTLRRSTISSLLRKDMNQSLTMVRVVIVRVAAAAVITITSRLPLLVRSSQAAVEVAAHPQAAEVEITRIKVIKEAATTESDLCMHN
jgi:hypothetical protein